MKRHSAVLSLVLFAVLLGAGCATGNLDPDRQFDDAVVATRVRNAIEADGFLSGSSITVSVDRGIVTLRGVVRDTSQLSRAQTVASGVEGVLSVQNELSVN